MEPLAHGVGIIALIVSLVALSRSDNRGLLWWMAAASLLWAMHLGALGAFSGALMALIAIPRQILTEQARALGACRRTRLLIAATCTLMILGAAAYTVGSLVDALPVAALLLITWIHLFTRGIPFRASFVLGNLLYLGYALAIGSLTLALATLFTLAALAVGIQRMHRAQSRGERIDYGEPAPRPRP
ncbi:hypothetical protein J2T57_001225 [Natronocella acetinitrilica]|uniref:YgjV family protein n=1 Tax=Natronocella acetinitrilica TaxID=414046 RepID=A0AAE3G2T7_9GAMM|nr:YgjV family protein [Natronocella acetinitrilica]MCP1674123.1 hypothetical protein [Natronocella acetinitrilica]